MAARFRVTYDIVTPESAEDGDVADAGWAGPGGWKFAVDDPGPHELSLREAIYTAGGYAGGCYDCGRWVDRIDSDTDYRTGEETRYSLHPPEDISQASYARLRRYLTGR